MGADVEKHRLFATSLEEASAFIYRMHAPVALLFLVAWPGQAIFVDTKMDESKAVLSMQAYWWPATKQRVKVSAAITALGLHALPSPERAVNETLRQLLTNLAEADPLK